MVGGIGFASEMCNRSLAEKLNEVVFADAEPDVEPILYAFKMEPATRVCSDCGDYVVPTPENRCPDCDQPL